MQVLRRTLGLFDLDCSGVILHEDDGGEKGGKSSRSAFHLDSVDVTERCLV